MPSLKDIKRRIDTVRKTRQITSAMKLVAAAKLRRATEAATSAKPYQTQLAEVLRRVAERAGESSANPLLDRRESVRRVLVVVLTSDRGLAGPFNNTLLRRTKDWVEERRAAGVEVVLDVYGRKGRGFFRYLGWDLRNLTVDYGRTAKMELVTPLSDQVVESFVTGEFDEVYIAFNTFVNTLIQRPTFRQVLPLEVGTPEPADEDGAASGLQVLVDYRYEPSPTELLDNLLPLYLRTLVLQTFLETEAGEYAARMTAMENATRNASDLIGNLTLQYNRARQAAITKELIEIVSGAEAL